MATPAQIIANKANSQHSTGPVTDAGKAKSSRNRLSHGFASSTRFIEGEDSEQFNALLYGLIHEFEPVTLTQQILVEMMAHHRWVFLRAARLQGDQMIKMWAVGDVLRTLPLLIRYQTTAERAFHKAHCELVKAQKQTGNREIGFESQKAPEPVEVAPEPASGSADRTPEPPPPAAQNRKPAPQTTPEVAVDSDFPSMEAELEWIMNASIEEIRASGL